MGCGALGGPLLDTVFEANEPISEQVRPDSNKINVIISCHSDQQNIAEELQQRLRNQNNAFHILTDVNFRSIVVRASCIQQCDVCIILICQTYQQSQICMETANYAKDLEKKIITIVTELNFQPYGTLGVILANAVESFTFDCIKASDELISQLSGLIVNDKIQGRRCINYDSQTIDPRQFKKKLNCGKYKPSILLCTVDDVEAVAKLIYENFSTKNLSVGMENMCKASMKCSIQSCHVLVPVLSPKFEELSQCRMIFEQARELQKPIIPVIAIENWQPKGWLGLCIATSSIFHIFDDESAYEPLFNSNRMTELLIEVKNACTLSLNSVEPEEIEIRFLKEKIEEYKSTLPSWPPTRKPRVIEPNQRRIPARIKLAEPKASLDFVHTYHSITRTEVEVPSKMFDSYGIPKRRILDCMISYYSDNVSLVMRLYEDMLMRSLQTWFDVWSNPMGKAREAMATAVECAKVLLVFLSKAYIESINCLMEFRYAMYRGKAFVIIRTEPNIQVEQWMIEAIQGFPQYDIYSYAALEQLINGVPTIDVIMQALRKLVQTQPPDVINDCSAELFELRCLLDDARDAISIESGQTRYKTCTRCHQQFDEYTKGGCKNHSAHYMGGNIVENHWVCCRQQERDAFGCNPCDHTDSIRIFTSDSSQITWKWVPQ